MVIPTASSSSRRARSFKGLRWPRPSMLAPSSTTHDLWLFPARHACMSSVLWPSRTLLSSIHLSKAILVVGCLSTTRNDPFTAGTFHSVPRGGLLCLLHNRIIYGRRRHSGIYHPLSSSPVFGWLAGSNVFDLTGVALFGRALFPSPLFPLYGGWKAIKPTPTMPHHSSASLPSLPLSEYLKCRRRCPLVNYLK